VRLRTRFPETSVESGRSLVLEQRAAPPYDQAPTSRSLQPCSLSRGPYQIRATLTDTVTRARRRIFGGAFNILRRTPSEAGSPQHEALIRPFAAGRRTAHDLAAELEMQGPAIDGTDLPMRCDQSLLHRIKTWHVQNYLKCRGSEPCLGSRPIRRFGRAFSELARGR